MLDLSQEAIILLEDLPLLHRQAAHPFQLDHRCERLPGPDVLEIAAIEQLQELDAEFDVANAALPRLHVAHHRLRRCVRFSMRRLSARMPAMSAQLK